MWYGLAALELSFGNRARLWPVPRWEVPRFTWRLPATLTDSRRPLLADYLMLGLYRKLFSHAHAQTARYSR